MALYDLSDSIEMDARSDVGMVRRNNEDAVAINPGIGLALLADGMGGHNAGEVASGMAITVLGSEIEHALREKVAYGQLPSAWVRGLLNDIIGRTNAAVHLAARSNPRLAGMGTTLVLGLYHDNRLTVAHVGDSRLYRWRAGQLEQLTRDHSLLQDQIDIGIISPEQARFAANKNLVTRALGVDVTVSVDIAEHETLPGDLFLLCSDGLNDMVEDAEIAATLAQNLPHAALRLVDAANARGGRDNVSVILVKINKPFPFFAFPESAKMNDNA